MQGPSSRTTVIESTAAVTSMTGRVSGSASSAWVWAMLQAKASISSITFRGKHNDSRYYEQSHTVCVFPNHRGQPHASTLPNRRLLSKFRYCARSSVLEEKGAPMVAADCAGVRGTAPDET